MDDQMAKQYRRKQKETLVMDCVYLNSERNRLSDDFRRLHREHEAQERELVEVKAKLRGFALVNGKLTEAITALRDCALIGS